MKIKMSHVNGSAMKQIAVKNIGNCIDLMEWSNKMDLVAVSNEKGEVLIKRLNWQKVCLFPPPNEGDENPFKVRALCWQPDEPILAIAYSNGKVSLVSVELEDEIFELNFFNDIKSMSWTKYATLSNITDTYENELQEEDSYKNFLLPLANLASVTSGIRKNSYYNSLREFSQKTPNFLVIALTNGKIFLTVFGILRCGGIDVTQYVNNKNDFEIIDARMSISFEEIFVFLRDGNHLKNLVFRNDILSKYRSPLLNIAEKHGNIIGILNYMSDTIQCISEAWETVLMEMDSKLAKYAESQPEGKQSLSADFLELLMFGYPSEALESFLTRDLTEKGLKKLANSIELSYTTIQNLVVKSLQTATTNLIFHLNTFKGLSQNTYCYKSLLHRESVEKACKSAGSFLMKVIELQQTIDQSVNDYKIFWCWLTVVILRFLEETVPDDAATTSQEDIAYLASFLNTFDDRTYTKSNGEKARYKFNLERVGQYLENANLECPPKDDVHHQWNNLLEQNECLRNCKLIYQHNKEYSLIQQYNKLNESIKQIFIEPGNTIEANFIPKCTIQCAEEFDRSHTVLTSHMADEKQDSNMLLATKNPTEFIFLELSTQLHVIKAAILNLKSVPFSSKEKFRSLLCSNDICLKDMQFYNDNTLSLLILAKDSAITTGVNQKISNYFVQLPMENIREKCSLHQIADVVELNSICELSILDFIDQNSLKLIEGAVCTKIAVSGNRKIASILSDNSRKIRIFEMEIEDEDEDEMCAQNTTVENGKDSMQE